MLDTNLPKHGMNLNEYMTDDGLVPTSLLKWRCDRLYLANSEQEVWLSPNARSVTEILRERKVLWQMAKLRVQPHDIIQARAPIFGVPFDKALNQLSAIRPNQSFIKSKFQRFDSNYLEASRRGVVATMVVHVGLEHKASCPQITLEAWQVPDAEAETFYLHAIFDVSKRYFVHLDGATIYHDTDAKQMLFDEGNKVKGDGKQKFFRLDGEISPEDVRKLGKAFLPLEDLSTEYFLEQQDSDAQM